MTGRPDSLSRREYLGGDRLEGPLLFVEGASDAAFAEIVEVVGPDGSVRRGRVLEVGEDRAVIEVWGETGGLHPPDLRIRLLGRPLHVPVGRDMLGRVFDGFGRPRDGLPTPRAEDRVDVHGAPLNPAARSYPRSYIETGVSVIDGLNTLVRGQKLPIFSGSGLPHDELALQIARQARLAEEEEQDFALIFVAIGVGHDTAETFRESFEESGSLERTALFLNLADDSAMERTIIPRVALCLAEFLAFRRDHHVLVMFTDMTGYAEAVRELSGRREEVPTRKGYPGYLYTDLASIYERCGRVRDAEGSITQLPVLTMPNDDITHPIPDLTGYITEGQLVLDRSLHRKGIYPPLSVLPSLSRLMKDGVGEGRTRADHPDLADQLYAAYARAEDVRGLAEIVGEEELSDVDRTYLRFADAFEERFLGQGEEEVRRMEETLDLGWEVLGELPRNELTRVGRDAKEEHYPGDADA